MPCSLRYLIPGLLLLFAVVAGGISLTYNYQVRERQVEEEAMRDFIQHMSRLQATTEYLLLSNDLPRVQEEIAANGADPHVISAILVDDKNIVLAALQRRMIGRPAGTVLPRRPAEGLAARTARMLRVRETMAGEVSLRPDRQSVRAVYPVLLGSGGQGLRPSRIGLIYVLSDLAALKAQARRDVESQVLQYSAMLVLLAALLWLAFYYLLGRPVAKLVAASARFADGDLNARAGLTGHTELATLGRAFDQMVERVAQGQRALARSEEHYRLLFNAGDDAIFVSQPRDDGRAGRLIAVNEVACRRLGYSREELLELDPLDVVAPEEHGRIPWLINNPRNDERFLYETFHVTRDGRHIPVEANVHVLEMDGRLTVLTVARDITQRRLAEEKLRKSEERFSKAFHANPDLMTISRMNDGRFIDVNEAFLDATGYNRSEIVGRTAAEIGLWVELKEQDAVLKKLQDECRVSDIEARFRTKSGEPRLALFSGELIDVDGETCLLAASKDITERKRIEEQLYEEKERAQVTLQAIGDAVITTDAQGRVELINPAAEELLGWKAAEARNVAVTSLFTVVSELTGEAIENPVQKCLREGEIVAIANYCILVTRDGREVAIEDSAAPIRDRNGSLVGTVAVLRDVSKARKLAHQMSWQASHDALTGLMNRREFEERLSHAIATAREGGEHHALLYLDLDQFKIVNDTCGHVAGDELLRQLSGLIQSHMRDTDTFARLGGDEFGVLLEHCPLEQAKRIADTLRQLVGNFHFVWEGKPFGVGVSIGLVNITATSGPVESVLSAADMACYAAKDTGRNRVHVYSEDDAAMVKHHGEMQWVARITRAFEEKRFRLFRQAIVDVRRPDSLAQHHEVLIRMLDEQGNLVLPDAFLPAAERYGMMPSVDRWVIRTLFANEQERLREAWNRCSASAGACDCTYSINLSGSTLDDDAFLGFVRQQLDEHHIPPQMVCFEITETVAIAHLPKAVHFIREMKSLGCRFSLDDFGSGVSSFVYLKNLPVDYLKIDGSLVRDMHIDPIARAMVASINTVGHVMGIATIAEFVESEAILVALREIGVDYAQGYAIDKPCAINT
ncbi:MAG TPA: EAL domain-containing protein [Sulfuriferula sp.]|nr:EAL domain-containing protein [Sulfuriferula sp.]